MAKMESFLKLMKGIGKNVGMEAAGLGVLGAGIGRAGYETGKFGFKHGKKMFRGLKEGEEAEGILQKVMPVKMKGIAVAGVTAALGVGAITDTGLKTKNRNELGGILSGEMANTVGISRSPNLDATVDKIQNDEKFQEKFNRDKLGANTYGAEGDLVFALHNLRNGTE